jgi:Holliday junction resolvase RusA-like endonuclease
MRNSCEIGVPISANAMYTRTKTGMAKSKKYRQWLELNVPLVESLLDKPTCFPVSIEVVVMDGNDWKHGRDIDNVAKPLVDLLVKSGVLPDDSTQYVEKVDLKFLGGSRKSPTLTWIRIAESEAYSSEWSSNFPTPVQVLPT